MAGVAQPATTRRKSEVLQSSFKCMLTALLVWSAWVVPVPGLALEASRTLQQLFSSAPEFLPVDQAFKFSAEAEGDAAVLARWIMPAGYYLYRHAFAVQVRPLEATADVVLGELEIPPGLAKIDDYFGAVEVYYHELALRVPVASGSGRVEVGVTYQGCADAGLCYPPETRWTAFNLSAPGRSDLQIATQIATQIAPQIAPQIATPPSAPPTQALTEERRLAALLTDSGRLTALALFFLGGVALAFTPCVLPMVPILSSIIVGQGGTLTRARAFTLSLSYVIGMALTYAAVGTLVGLFGATLNLQAALQSGPVLVVFAALFVLLALSMFGFYELRLPQRWQNGLDALGARMGGGRHFSVVVMGALSALVVSPCVSAPLAGALIYLSTTGDAVLGGSALLALGLGMGVPLLVIGASGGHLLPRAGAWMNAVKAVFGVGLLAVAVWLLERVVPAGVTLALWASLAIGVGVYLGALDFAPRQGWGQLWKAGGALSFVYGVLLLIGAASGADDPLKPLARIGGAAEPAGAASAVLLDWETVRGFAELQAALEAPAAGGRPILLDLYADWCVSCKVMERSVFPRPEVAAQLAQFRLLKADLTRNTAEDKALLDAFGLFGPPGMVFFSPDGNEWVDARIQGEIGAAPLAAHLAAVLRQFAATAPAAAAPTEFSGAIAVNY